MNRLNNRTDATHFPAVNFAKTHYSHCHDNDKHSTSTSKSYHIPSELYHLLNITTPTNTRTQTPHANTSPRPIFLPRPTNTQINSTISLLCAVFCANWPLVYASRLTEFVVLSFLIRYMYLSNENCSRSIPRDNVPTKTNYTKNH